MPLISVDPVRVIFRKEQPSQPTQLSPRTQEILDQLRKDPDGVDRKFWLDMINDTADDLLKEPKPKPLILPDDPDFDFTSSLEGAQIAFENEGSAPSGGPGGSSEGPGNQPGSGGSGGGDQPGGDAPSGGGAGGGAPEGGGGGDGEPGGAGELPADDGGSDRNTGRLGFVFRGDNTFDAWMKRFGVPRAAHATHTFGVLRFSQMAVLVIVSGIGFTDPPPESTSESESGSRRGSIGSEGRLRGQFVITPTRGGAIDPLPTRVRFREFRSRV